MDLKQLKTFIRVAETGSLSKASDRLRLAQPALSRHIRMLESEVGLDLFVRHGRGMELTEPGKALFERVHGLVFQLDKSIDDIRDLPHEPRGHVALGLMPTISHILAARVARRVALELPEVTLRISEGLTGHLIEWLHRGEIDLSLLPGPGADLHLRVIDLLFEKFVLVGPSDCGLAEDAPVPVKALEGLPLILPGRPHGQRSVVEAAAEKAGIKLSIKFEADSLPLELELVEAGLGYTVLPMSAIYHEIATGRFRIAPLVRPSVPRQLILALPTSRVDTRATVAVTALVIDEIGALVQTGVWRASPDTGLLNHAERSSDVIAPIR